MRAAKLRTGDRIRLNGFTREVVRIEPAGSTSTSSCDIGTNERGAAPVLQLRVAFINGGAITVASTFAFEVDQTGGVAPAGPVSVAIRAEPLGAW